MMLAHPSEQRLLRLPLVLCIRIDGLTQNLSDRARTQNWKSPRYRLS